MGRRQLAGQDEKIKQGHRRDEFFTRMRRKGGVPRMPTEAPASGTALEEQDQVAADTEEEPAGAASDSEASRPE